MDTHRESAEKKQGEVVVLISGEGQSNTKYPKVESFEESFNHKANPFSPEIVLKTPGRPPRPPSAKTLMRRKSILRPKSRFVEQTIAVPISNLSQDSLHTPYIGSPNPWASGTLKSQKDAEEDAEEEEEEVEVEIFRREQVRDGPVRRKRFRVWNLIEWLILVLAIACWVASELIDRLQSQVFWGLEIWRWCLVVVVCCGRLVTSWFIHALLFMIERNFILKKKVLYFVYGLKKSVQVFLWLFLVLLSWLVVFNHEVPRSPRTERVLHFVSQLLISLLVGSVIWLVKTLLVKILASTIHMNRFFDRIQESIFYQYVLQTLSGPPVMELAKKIGAVTTSGQLSFRSKGKWKGKGKREVIDVSKFYKMRQEKVSAWTMKGLVNVIRTTGLSTLSNTIDESFNEDEQREITSEWEAKAVAYRIFKNVANPGSKFIDADDLLRFLSREEVEYVLPLFEGAGETGKIRKSALKNWVMIVEEMNILTTVFLKFDNEKIYYPNSVLATKPISNFNRSPDMSDGIEFSIDVSTSMETIGALKSKIKMYIESKPIHWHPDHSIMVNGIVDANKMNLGLYVNHTINFQNMGEKNSRRTDLVLELKRIFEVLSIRYSLPHQEVHLCYIGSNPLPMALSQSTDLKHQARIS